MGQIESGWHSGKWEKTVIPFFEIDENVKSIYQKTDLMYFRYTDQVQGGRSLNLKIGSQIKVLPNQTVKSSPGISFDPNNPKICGKIFTVASMNPMKFTEPFPENMRNTQNGSFTFKVVQLK